MSKAKDKNAEAGAKKTEPEVNTVSADSERNKQALETLQLMVGEIVKELGMQDGFELADTAEGLQMQLHELQHVKTEREAEAAALEAQPKKGDCTVSDGCSVTTKRGIMGAGEIITADDSPGGKDSLNAHVKSMILNSVK